MRFGESRGEINAENQIQNEIEKIEDFTQRRNRNSQEIMTEAEIKKLV